MKNTTRGIAVAVTLLVFVAAGQVALAEKEPSRPSLLSELSPEEAGRPAEQWTLEQVRGKGWTPYGCFPGIDVNGPATRATTGTRWPMNDASAPALGSCVSYSFMPDGVALEPGSPEGPTTWFTAMPAGSSAAVAAATASWAAVADLHFTLVTDGGGPFNIGGATGTQGNLRVSSGTIPAPGVLAHGYFPPPNGITAAGDIHFDTAWAWVTAGPAPGPPFDVETVALHELGHALGLTHAATVPADIMFPVYSGIKTTPAAGDIGFITSVYGAGPHVATCEAACCYSATVCGTRTEAMCLSTGGTWQGPGTACPTMGVFTAMHASGTIVHWANPAMSCFAIAPPAPLPSPPDEAEVTDVSQDENTSYNISANVTVTEGAAGGDLDGDSIPDDLDNCPEDFNIDQLDADLDNVGDVCDNCPEDPNPDQADSNGNGVGDVCDGLCPKIDAWMTSEEPTQQTCHLFGPPAGPESPPIPSDFFEPGSEPFFGEVCLIGQPLGPTPFGDFGVADTLILRSDDPFDRCELPSPDQRTVDIEIVALNLQSIAPINVLVNGQDTLWDVQVDLSQFAPQPLGQLQAEKTHCNGGTYSSGLNVQPRFTFTKLGGPGAPPGTEQVLDTGEPPFPLPPIQFNQDPHPWTHDLDPYLNLDGDNGCTKFFPGIEDPNQFPACDCNGNFRRDQCDIEDTGDCNANGLPDECDPDGDGDGIPDDCDGCPDSPGALCAPGPGETDALFVGKTALPGTYELTYTAGCSAGDHTVVYGPMGAVSLYGYSGQDCNIGTSGTYSSFSPGLGSVFMLIVANDGGTTEGSYGLDSGSTERPEDPGDPVCPLTQDLVGRCD